MSEKVPHFDEIVKLLKKGPAEDEAGVHALADSIGVNKHSLEEEIYTLASAFWANGKSKDFSGKYDEKELKMGIEVEQEHTNDPRMAERIAKDHLAEIPDYYTRLKKMEDEAKSEKKAAFDLGFSDAIDVYLNKTAVTVDGQADAVGKDARRNPIYASVKRVGPSYMDEYGARANESKTLERK